MTDIKTPSIPEDIRALISVYRKAQVKLVEIIATQQAKGNVTQYRMAILRRVSAEIELLNEEAEKWANEVIPKYYNKGVETVNNLMGEEGITLSGEFAGLHKDAINLLVLNTLDDLRGSHEFIGRIVQDQVREAGIQAVTQKISTGSTVKEMQKQLRQNLIDLGFKGIKDKRGRYIDLDAYAGTVARSTTREATNKATINQLQGNGYDLVKMSEHLTTCPICAPLQGRVYSISGNSNEYPPLYKAHTGIHANIHPNCKHVLTPYIPELADSSEADKEFSNRPFDIDPRSRRQKEAYEKAQQRNRELRRDRNQWQRYRMAMPEDTPKTFAGFRRSKLANSENFKQLESNYRSIMIKEGRKG